MPETTLLDFLHWAETERFNYFSEDELLSHSYTLAHYCLNEPIVKSSEEIQRMKDHIINMFKKGDAWTNSGVFGNTAAWTKAFAMSNHDTRLDLCAMLVALQLYGTYGICEEWPCELAKTWWENNKHDVGGDMHYWRWKDRMYA